MLHKATKLIIFYIRRGPKLEGCVFANFGNSSGARRNETFWDLLQILWKDLKTEIVSFMVRKNVKWKFHWSSRLWDFQKSKKKKNSFAKLQNKIVCCLCFSSYERMSINTICCTPILCISSIFITWQIPIKYDPIQSKYERLMTMKETGVPLTLCGHWKINT